MANEITMGFTTKGEFCETGDIFLIDGHPYILTSVSYDKLMFTSLKDGNRWDDPFTLKPNTMGKYNIDEVIDRIQLESITGDSNIEYIGAVRIEVMR